MGQPEENGEAGSPRFGIALLASICSVILTLGALTVVNRWLLSQRSPLTVAPYPGASDVALAVIIGSGLTLLSLLAGQGNAVRAAGAAALLGLIPAAALSIAGSHAKAGLELVGPFLYFVAFMTCSAVLANCAVVAARRIYEDAPD